MLGFGLGLMHAFDADHVMTLSVYASRSRDADQKGDGIRLGLKWALGHGLVLLATGILLLVVGQALPEAWFVVAERIVALVMIGLGLRLGFELISQRRHLHFHTHDELAPHAHWHSHAPTEGPSSVTVPESAHRHSHGPMLVGGLHGLAGSAGVLAVVPAASGPAWVGLLYLFIFAIGVALAMALVSGLLGEIARRFASPTESGVRLGALRASSALGSVALGIWMLAVV